MSFTTIGRGTTDNDGTGTPAKTAAAYLNELIGAANAGQLQGFKNRIINGAFDIWQRGTRPDRWLVDIPTGGAVTKETSDLPTDAVAAMKYLSSASNAFFQCGQQIELANFVDLRNTTVTISFKAKALNANAGSTGLTARTRSQASVDANSTVFTSSASDTSVTLTTSWASYAVTRTLGAAIGSLTLEFVLGSHVSGDGFIITDVMISPGAVAGPFERRPIQIEQMLCERYFEKSYDVGVAPGTTGDPTSGLQYFIIGTSGSIGGKVNFRVRKRSNPTKTTYDRASTPNSGKVSTNAGNNQTGSIILGGEGGFVITASSSTEIAFHWTADSEFT